jgi:hypothetical protein
MDYWVYGLGISSNVEIPAFGRWRTLPDCEIHFETGPEPDWVREIVSLPGETVYSPEAREWADSTLTITGLLAGKFLEFKYADRTRFVMDRGTTRIWSAPGPGLTNDDVFVYLAGPIMGFALRRRERFALHASSVLIGDGAIAICGDPGSGKSTTAAALALRGNPVMCEDICPLQKLDDRKHVVPGYPRIGLWPDSVGHLFAAADALPLISAGWEKRYLPLDGRLATFAENPAPLAAIYLLAPRSDAPVAPFIEPLSRRESVLALVQNTYMNYLLRKEQRAAEFDAIANLVAEVDCYRVTPHADPARLGELAALIETHAANVMNAMDSRSSRIVRADVQP